MRAGRPLDFAAVVHGGSRGFGVLLIGGLLQPLVGAIAPLAFAWLLLVAVAAFALAAVRATPWGTPVTAWRQAPIASVLSYALILPLVLIGAGELPVLQLLLTTITAVLVGTVVGLARTHFEASRGQLSPS